MAQANRPEGLAGGGRGAGGITGAGGKYVNPVYKEVGPTVKVIKPGSKPLTPKSLEAKRSAEKLRIDKSINRIKNLKKSLDNGTISWD